MQSILNLSHAGLVAWCEGKQIPKYRAKQIMTEIFSSRHFDFDEMTTLPKDLRAKLAEDFTISSIVHAEDLTDIDGATKFLFEMQNNDHNRVDGKKIECVLIPQRNSDNVTLCVSSQEGCKLDCKFCATGKLGWKSNLTTGEILSQYLISEELSGKKISNIVFMGMGDPLDNYENVVRALTILLKEQKIFGKNRITLSTAGFPDRIRELADSGLNVKLALSLHSTTQAKRENIMPSAKNWRLPELVRALEYYYTKTRQVITFEYILFDGFNDSDDDIKALRKLCSHFPAKINLIKFHDIEFTGYQSLLKPTTSEHFFKFATELRKFGLDVFTRVSAGEGVAAACGQLALKQNKKSNSND
ncbi:MAG: 23S rRNA (adenine(2503)-C(2))-methyltransferase RlmN [Candidatus Kapabacteria bacterium]|nr:23S rRNA (adenine(2503)-C(2))-methyltransferase RlmN [Candidatus Kapabacteria bacterium]